MQEQIENKVSLQGKYPLPKVLIDDDGIRPAGKQDECFYCRQKVGQPHKLDCVILSRKVKVRYTYDIEIEVPYYWDKKTIEFNRNFGSWCANNSLDELKEFGDRIGCLCSVFKAEVLEIPDAIPYRRNNKGEIIIP